MKKAFNSLILLTGLLLLAACDNDLQNPPQLADNAPGMGRLTVALDGTDGRTLLPQAPVFSRYALRFRYMAGGVSDINETADTLPFSIELLPGNWNVTVTGYTYAENVEGLLDGYYTAASGEKTVTIEANISTPVTVDLYRISGSRGVFQYDIGLPTDGLGSATLNILRADRTVVTTKNLRTSASGGIALDEGYYFAQVRVVTGRVRSKTELIHIYSGHTTVAGGAAWDFDTEEGVYLSLAELSDFLSATPINTADNPYPVKLITDWAALSTSSEFLGQMYGVLNGRYISVDLSETTNVNGIVATTAYSANRNRLVSVVLPEGLTEIGGGAFRNCTGLSGVTIPDSVTGIGNNAFSGCTGLIDITIPDSVTGIGNNAFRNCTGLTSITIPDSVTSIGSGAFDGCTGLTSVTFNGIITSSGFSSSSPFPGDLRDKYLAEDGGVGTYITANPGSDAVWTKLIGIANISAVWIEGNAVSLTVPAVTLPDGETVTAQGWQISDTAGGGWANFTPPATAGMYYHGKYLRYYAVSSGGATLYSNVVIIVVFDINNIVVTNTGEWNAVKTIISGGGDYQTYTINVSGDVPVEGSIEDTFGTATGITVTLKGSGRLYLTSAGRIITLAADQTLIIDSAGLTLQGLKNGQNGASQDNNTAAVYVNAAQLELRNGTISGNFNSSSFAYGGGVYVAANATFTMKGGTISGNTSYSTLYSCGGGVYVAANATFTMNSGTISGNSASGGYQSDTYGGGVYVAANATFTMNSGAISGNSVSGFSSICGGGVYVGSNGTFTMNSGTISDNRTSTSMAHIDVRPTYGAKLDPQNFYSLK